MQVPGNYFNFPIPNNDILKCAICGLAWEYNKIEE